MVTDENGVLVLDTIEVFLATNYGIISPSTVTVSGGVAQTKPNLTVQFLTRPTEVTVRAVVTTAGYSGSGEITIPFEAAAP